MIKTLKKTWKKIDHFYEKHYKALLIIPFLILVISLCFLGYKYYTTGSLIELGISLSGGLTITIPSQNHIDINEISQLLQKNIKNDFEIREISEFGEQKAITISVAAKEGDDLNKLEKEVINLINQKIPYAKETYSVEIMGPSLGKSFLQQTVKSLIVAFLFMALTVFFYFRTLVPSSAVVLAAFSDMVETLAIISFMGMKLSTAGIAAFLMLIGYSVDTDILLSTRVLKRREKSVYERIKSAIGTGFLMNLTTLAAVSVALIITQSAVIEQIMTILLIGLLLDIINTWIQNAGILRLYAESKEAKKK